MLSHVTVLSLLSAAVADRPNVLFVVVDDLAPVGEQYGGAAKTPSLGKLAAESTQFQQAHVSVAVCAPSRTAFLTGLRPDTSQVWTIGPYWRNTSRGKGLDTTTLPQHFRQHGYNVTGAGKIFHPGTASGGLMLSEGGGDQCPAQSVTNDCARGPALDEPGSWSVPHFFCDQYAGSISRRREFQCKSARRLQVLQRHGAVSRHAAVAVLTQRVALVWHGLRAGPGLRCLLRAVRHLGRAGLVGGVCARHLPRTGRLLMELTRHLPYIGECPDDCYPEGLIAVRTIEVLREKAAAQAAAARAAVAPAPWFHAMGLKRPHLSYRAPARYFELYPVDQVALLLALTALSTCPKRLPSLSERPRHSPHIGRAPAAPAALAHRAAHLVLSLVRRGHRRGARQRQQRCRERAR